MYRRKTVSRLWLRRRGVVIWCSYNDGRRGCEKGKRRQKKIRVEGVSVMEVERKANKYSRSGGIIAYQWISGISSDIFPIIASVLSPAVTGSLVELSCLLTHWWVKLVHHAVTVEQICLLHFMYLMSLPIKSSHPIQLYSLQSSETFYVENCLSNTLVQGSKESVTNMHSVWKHSHCPYYYDDFTALLWSLYALYPPKLWCHALQCYAAPCSAVQRDSIIDSPAADFNTSWVPLYMHLLFVYHYCIPSSWWPALLYYTLF